jgi:hypothetical protein
VESRHLYSPKIKRDEINTLETKVTEEDLPVFDLSLGLPLGKGISPMMYTLRFYWVLTSKDNNDNQEISSGLAPPVRDYACVFLGSRV